MALSNVTLAPIVPSSSCSCCYFFTRSSNYGEITGFETLPKYSGCSFPTVRNRWRSGAVDTRIGIVENGPVSSSSSSRTPTVSGTAVVDIPVSCYQLIGVSSQAEKDEIVKSVMNLKGAEVDDGYTMDAIVSRQEVLMDVRDKLLFETEYAGNVKEKIPPKSSLRIPWSWLPAALCLLQEVGEEKLVLEIGRAAVQRPDAKPYLHDLLLSMALAEVRQKGAFLKCSIAKIGFEKSKVFEGFEALARAQCLLRSTKSLRQMTLLSQIEESLEELAPACTLELLGLPQSPENAERRRGAVAALRELLRQGLDVESSCQVQDWSSFLSQALNRLLASEIIDILPWDNLAIARKNKKSIESQNQRVVIDFACFYMALIAHIALGFSSRQTDLINKAKIICECLITSEGNDLKLEEAFCLFLLGQGSEAEVIEKLQQLESTSNPAPQNSITQKEIKDSSSHSSLDSIFDMYALKDTYNAVVTCEMWLKDAVLSRFPDTRDSSPSLANYFGGQRKASGVRKSKGAPQTMTNFSHRSLSTVLASERQDYEDSLPRSAHSKGSNIGGRIKKLLDSAKVKFGNPLDARSFQSSCLPASLSSSITTVDRKQMPVEEAEALVRQWQAIKAEALGPGHQVDSLSEALDESMLIQWQALADTAKARCCYWKFVLLRLTILRADILLDRNTGETAEIEALLEEAAELVDESQPKNPNYYSTYKIRYILKRQDDGSWKFCGGDIEMPS
ncbi:hypothetical protein COLO4_24905 [Corchorus olitorius]|uniref:Uncharacterized protein n=1 Tax=Corchorus olitorius TaxID=93759 RepID=A0A1R3I5Z4_9ROSI|nr:hypothetical protein COLO4_24905 [Corchorus olitorius]